jgi:glycosyltransferase involved in cell wall biosynthesis
MWARVPVVAAAVGGVPFLVRDGETGFLARPDEPEALAERIVFVLRNPGLAAEVAARAHEAAAEFIWPYDRPGHLRTLLDAAGLAVNPPKPRR